VRSGWGEGRGWKIGRERVADLLSVQPFGA
jgi:hypothetical protein